MNLERDPYAAPRRRHESVDREEELIWVRFYAQARRDATLAMEILAELDRDEVLRRRHRGLCLSCQRCIRLHEHREARNRRLGGLVRHACTTLFIAAPQAVFRGARHGGQLLLACLPGSDRESAEDLTRHVLHEDVLDRSDRAVRTRARKAASRQEATASGAHVYEARSAASGKVAAQA